MFVCTQECMHVCVCTYVYVHPNRLVKISTRGFHLRLLFAELWELTGPFIKKDPGVSSDVFWL